MNVYTRYQAPGSAGTFYDTDASAAAAHQKVTESRTKRQRKHYVSSSSDIRTKFRDFPVLESKRDRLKQRDKPQLNKKAAAEVVVKPKQSRSCTAVSDLERTDGAEEKMDV